MKPAHLIIRKIEPKPAGNGLPQATVEITGDVEELLNMVAAVMAAKPALAEFFMEALERCHTKYVKVQFIKTHKKP